MAAERDGAVDLAINLQVFAAGHVTFDLQAGTQARGAASCGTARTRARGDAKRRYSGCGSRGRRHSGWFGLRLLLIPHTSSLNWYRNVVWLRVGGAVWNHFSRVKRGEATRKTERL